MKRHHISFKYAWAGIIYCFTTQPNFRFHLLAAAISLMLGIFFRLLPWEWLILVFTICLVLVTEMINTALESIVDLLSPQHQQAAKTAKDAAAGMVLLAAAAALVTGLVIFLPHFISLYHTTI